MNTKEGLHSRQASIPQPRETGLQKLRGLPCSHRCVSKSLQVSLRGDRRKATASEWPAPVCPPRGGVTVLTPPVSFLDMSTLLLKELLETQFSPPQPVPFPTRRTERRTLCTGLKVHQETSRKHRWADWTVCPGSVLQDSFDIWFKLLGGTKEQNLFEWGKKYNPTPHFTKNRNQSFIEGYMDWELELQGPAPGQGSSCHFVMLSGNRMKPNWVLNYPPPSTGC